MHARVSKTPLSSSSRRVSSAPFVPSRRPSSPPPPSLDRHQSLQLRANSTTALKSYKYRWKNRPLKTKESHNGTKGPPKCLLCGNIDPLTMHQCQLCPATYLCARCVINKRLCHYDHPFEQVQEVDHECGEDEKGELIENGAAVDSEAEETLAAVSSASPRASKAPTQRPACYFCSQELTTLWYECKDCPQTYLCPSHSVLHCRSHNLSEINPMVPGKAQDRASPLQSDEACEEADGNSICDDNRTNATEPNESDEDEDEDEDEDDEELEDDTSEDGELEGEDDEEAAITGEDRAFEDFLPATSKAAVEAIRREAKKQAEEASKAIYDAAQKQIQLIVKEAGRFSAARLSADKHKAVPRKRRSARHWLPQDRRRLARLKEKGWADEDIGTKLGRTAGAVAQQWRKQQPMHGA